MTIKLKPEIEQMIQERVQHGPFRSADELVNAALEQFMSDDFTPGELDKLLTVGEQQASRSDFVDGDEVFRRLKEHSQLKRKGA